MGFFRSKPKPSSSLSAREEQLLTRINELEEFIEGEDYTFDTVAIDGEPAYFNIAYYRPRALVCRENHWMSQQTICRRDVDSHHVEDGRKMGFAVMKALGVGPRQVFVLILAETAIQTALSAAVACVLALPCAWYLAQHGLNVGMLGGTSVMGLAMEERWMGVFGVSSVTTPLAVMVVIVAGATLFPAWRAARIRPVDAMRHP